MGSYMDIGKELLKTLIAPKQELNSTSGLSDKNLRAFLEQRGVADFLMYRYYKQINDELGIYTMADKKKGIILRVFPTSFSSQLVENAMNSLVDMLNEEGTVLNFNTFATRNTQHLIEAFKDTHNYTPNVDNAHILKEIVDDQYEFLRSGVNETLVKGLDMRSRDFISTISIVFPESYTQNDIIQLVAQIKGNLRDLNPINFEGLHLIRMINEMLNPDGNMSDWNIQNDPHRDMQKQMVTQGIKVKTNPDQGDIEVDNWKYRVLTTKQFPNDKIIISNYDLYNMFFDRFGESVQIPVPCPFMVGLTVAIGNEELDTEEALAKSRDDLIQVRKLGKDLRDADPDLENRMKEAKRNIKLIKENNQVPKKAMFTVTLMEKDETKLNKYSKVLKERFKAKDWILEEERTGNISLFAFLYSLPLQYYPTVRKFLNRFDLVFTSNCASIAPLIGGVNMAAPIIPYFDRSTMQLVGYNPFMGDNYNESKTGASGAGKSYSQAFAHAMKLSAGIMQRVIDNGHSYKRFCNAIGGTYIDVGGDKSISLNFFTKANTAKVTDENGMDTDEEILVDLGDGNSVPTLHSEEIEGIVPIIGLMVGLNFVVSGKPQSAEDATDEAFLSAKISSAVIETFLRHKYNGKLEHTRDILKEYYLEEKSLRNEKHAQLLYSVLTGMFNYADPKGVHYSKFNTPNNLDLKKDYVVMDTLGLKGVILSVVVVSLAFLIKSEFWKIGVKRKKQLDIDEGWQFKDNPIVIKILEDNARTLRKSMSGQAFITQGIEDFSHNKSMEALFGSSFHKFLLSQDKKSIAKVANGEFFPLDIYEERMYSSIANKKPYWGEALYLSKNNGGSAFIIKTSPKVHWLASGADPDGNKLFDEIQKKYNFSLIETIRYLALKDKDSKLSENDLIYLSKNDVTTDSKDAEEEERYWKEELNSAIKENRLMIKAEPLVSLKDNIIHNYEIQSFIEHHNKSKSSYNSFVNWAIKFGMEEQITEIIFSKSIEHFEDTDIMMHFNLNATALQNEKVLEVIENTIIKYKMSNRIILELKETSSNDSFKELQDFIKRFKDIGVKIALDNIDLHYPKWGYIGNLDVDFIKVEGGFIKEAIEKNNTKASLIMLVNYIKSSQNEEGENKKVIGIKIEDDEELPFLTEIELDYYQGFVLKDKNVIF